MAVRYATQSLVCESEIVSVVVYLWLCELSLCDMGYGINTGLLDSVGALKRKRLKSFFDKDSFFVESLFSQLSPVVLFHRFYMFICIY